MPSLLLTVFVLQLMIHLVNTVGAGAINDLLWMLYNKLPTSTAADVRSQTKLRREVQRLHREMKGTSSQDEFARWAKLRRQHDKASAEYDQKAQSLQTFKTSFDRTVTVLRWLCTNGLRFFLQFWYAKQPLFWLPRGWVPSYVEWILAFPRAPTGSVSVQVWGVACASIIRLVGAAAVAGWILLGKNMMGSRTAKRAMKMGGRNGAEHRESAPAGGRGGKKEL